MERSRYLRIVMAALAAAGFAVLGPAGGCGTGARPFGDGSVGSGGNAQGGSGGTGGRAGIGGRGGGTGGASGGTGPGGAASGSGGAVGGRGAAGTGSGGRPGLGGATATGGTAGNSPCPTSTPTSSVCPREGLICEYGQDPRPQCRSRATCTGGNWALTEVRCVPIPPVTGTCPATRDAAHGRPCAPDAAICSYGGLNCICASCPPDGPVGCAPDPATLTWHCEAPNVDPACPAVLPRLGSTCPSDGKQCTYKCGPEGARICRVGVWIPADGGTCPRSSREVKRDIEYLGAADLQQLAREIKDLRLATWRYRDPALAGRRHLGFIIEDQPELAAVDRQRGIVDLYGYTSMLAAAIQTQEREIQALRRQIKALKNQAAAPPISKPEPR